MRRQCGSGCCGGPLAVHAAGYRSWLVGQGFVATVVFHRLSQFGQFCRWLRAEELSIGGLDEVQAARFAAGRRARGLVTWASVAGMDLPLGYLRGAGVVAPRAEVVTQDACEVVLGSYRRYLASERGLVRATVAAYVRIARRFCRMGVTRPGGLAGLGAGDVSAFMVAECGRSSTASAKKTATALVALLRYLHVAGVTADPLASAVPGIAGRGPGLPVRGLGADELVRLLAGCDRGSRAGRRDYAVLLLLSRLGLRAGEVAALRLEDVDWHHGEVLIRGKGDRHERLPLPVDVGHAVADYLRHGRFGAPSECRAVFLRVSAPHGPLSSGAVSTLVSRAAGRAGLGVFGPHRLRHAAASEMLRRGVPLTGIAQVLRHHDLAVTASYATPEPAAVRELARPWPGVR